MAGLSQNWEQKVLEFIFKQTAFYTPAPTTLYYSLHTADPTDTVATALSNEVSGNNYARAQLNPDTSNAANTQYNAVDEPGARRITNKLDITFPPASGGAFASGASLTHWGLWTVLSSGTADQYVASGALSASVVVLSGQTLKFQGATPGAFSFTIE